MGGDDLNNHALIAFEPHPLNNLVLLLQGHSQVASSYSCLFTFMNKLGKALEQPC